MKLFKRCQCSTSCKHPYHFRYRFRRQLIRGTTGTSNQQVAREIATTNRADRLRKAAGLLEDTVPVISLKALVARYQKWVKDDHPASASKDMRVLAAFEDDLKPATRIDAITTWQILRWRSSRITAHRSRQTVEREMTVIRGLFTRAVEWKADTGLKMSPCVGIDQLRSDERPVRVATREEVALLIAAPPIVRLLCQLTLTSLGRLMELARLRPIDLKPGPMPQIEVVRKRGKVQQLPVTSAQMAELQALVATPKQPYVFFPGGLPIQADLSNSIRRWWRSVGVSLHHHAMRHTGVTWMLEAGINPRVIQELAGWTSLRQLQRYGHVGDAEKARAIAATSARLALPEMAGQEGTDATTPKSLKSV
jgi:integrase